jgi:uncharacterized protein
MFRSALVTGATSGIGEALCYLLNDKVDLLIITGRDEGKLNELTQALTTKVLSITADLAKNREKVVEAIRQYAPELLINNAGSGLYGEIFMQPTPKQMELASINVDALLELTLEGAKALKAAGKKGVILNVSSAASLLPFPCFSIYSATKAFVNQLSVSLDEELKEYGIRVLCACPGMVRTHFRQRASGNTGANHKSSSMSPDEAAHHIWRQIERGKQLYVFDWKVRWSIILAKWLVPRSLLMKLLKSSIKKIKR